MLSTQPGYLLTPETEQIVGKDSGVLNYPQEITAPVDADHHTIVKFNGPRDTNYVLVANVLKQITRGLQSQGMYPDKIPQSFLHLTIV